MAGLSRKTVTVLFSDVVDSTPLGEAVDPESVRELMARYFEEMRPVIERHGGTVEKYIGDEIMAVFGIPQVHEDDALRAVRAACEMRGALDGLNRDLAQPLRVRTALNTGEVVTGDRHTLVTGDAVNIAARLRTAAAPGEILVGSPTYDLVRDAVLAEPLEPLDLKGKSAPTGAWRVTAVMPDAPGRARRFDSELVGRQTELALLQQAYARALGSKGCHLFTLLGPAGVGKSRLVNGFLGAVRPNARALVGRCLSYGEGITYWPLRELVYALGDLGSFVGAAEADTIRGAVGASGAAGSREETFRAVRKLVEALAAGRPLVIGLEDLHWADPTFLDLIDHLAETIHDAPVLLICVARPELLDERPGWGGGKFNSTTILLEPLDADESLQLVANLGGAGIAADLRRLITEVAEGNPLFLEEMVALAIEDPAARTLPPTIHALLTARLDRLDPVERSVLAAASVAGRFFTRNAVAELAGTGVDEALATLARKELIRPQPVPFAHGDGYRFRHILLRDAAYDALPKGERARMHERLADWLPSSADEVEELVGWHLERAYRLRSELGTPELRLAERARATLAAVGKRALGRGDHAAAVSLLQRARELPGPSDEAYVELVVHLAGALRERGELMRAEELLAEALEHASALGDRRLEARALVERLFVRMLTNAESWVEEVQEVRGRAFDDLTAAGDEEGLARAWLLVVVFDYIRCRTVELESALEPALRFARRTGDRHQVSLALDASARAVLFSPLPIDESLRHCAQIAKTSGGDMRLDGVLRGVTACLLAMAGRFEEARQSYRDGFALLEELGRTRTIAVNRSYSGTVELLAGDPVAAERELRAGVESLERFDDKSNLATAAALLAQALAAQGRTSDATTYARISERHASHVDVISQIQWRLALAWLGADPDRALELAREAVALASETDSLTLQADALLSLRDALTAAGRADEAAEAANVALLLYEAKGNVVGAARAASPSSAAIVSSSSAGREGGT